jgi:hypothetical protein
MLFFQIRNLERNEIKPETSGVINDQLMNGGLQRCVKGVAMALQKDGGVFLNT